MKNTIKGIFTGKNIAQNFLAYFWSVCAAIYLYFITFSPIPPENIRIADTVLGFMMTAIVGTIISYYFGSSKSSADKNELLKGASDSTQADASTTRIADLVSAGWKTTADGYELNGKVITNDQIKALNDSDFIALMKA